MVIQVYPSTWTGTNNLGLVESVIIFSSYKAQSEV